MKILIIIRHSKAVWTGSDLSDFERDLDPQGVLDAEKLGQQLLQDGIIPDIIISSPANRAFKTTEIIVENLGLSVSMIKKKDVLYNAPTDTILSVVQSIDSAKSVVMLVGHNPGVSNFVSMITDGSFINMGTCDVAIIGLQIDSWKECLPGVGFISRYIENY